MCGHKFAMIVNPSEHKHVTGVSMEASINGSLRHS